MKMRKVIILLATSVLLTTLVASPALAKSRPVEFTGTIDFMSWVNPVPPNVTPGGTVHEQIVTEWLFDMTDSRVDGLLVASGGCTWPHEKPWPWGPCHLNWTLDVDADLQPDWEGVLAVTPQDYRVFWNGSGHGLGQFAGLNMTFKVEGGPFPPASVTGRITSE
jgi:hypothetical protein